MSAATTHATEKRIPLALMALGVALMLVRGLALHGAKGAALTLSMLIVATAFGTAIMLAAGFVTATALKVSFGNLGPAVLKMVGIFLFTNGLATVLPTGGSLVAAAVAVGLVVWLFELDVQYALVFGVVLWIIEFIVSAFVHGILDAHSL